MIIPILIGVGAIGTGGWIYHHLFIKKVDARLAAVEAKVGK